MERLGEPRAYVVDAGSVTVACHIKTARGAYGGQPRRGVGYRAAVGLPPFQKAILNDILGVGAGAENSVREPQESGACLLELIEVVVVHRRREMLICEASELYQMKELSVQPVLLQ